MTTELSKDALHDFIEAQTYHLDVVASWENLCEVYRVLEFTDQITDAIKLEEFKWIIGEMNKFLTKMRKKLFTCQDKEAMQEVLKTSFTPTGSVTLDSRRTLAFQKLKQRWINIMLVNLEQQWETQEESDEEGSEDAWRE